MDASPPVVVMVNGDNFMLTVPMYGGALSATAFLASVLGVLLAVAE
jgi:hypothetical protein